MKTRKRADFFELNDDLWEMIVCRISAADYARLTRTCRRLGNLWADKKIRSRILERFTVHRFNVYQTNHTWKPPHDTQVIKSHVRVILHMCRINSTLHRERDLPAIIEENGTKHWYQYGKLHRDGDFPAITKTDGSQWWYENDKLHREGDLPAIILANGSQYWYKNNQRHRDDDLPAAIRADGSQEWWKNGQRHRDGDLPAYIRADEYQEWWKNGYRYYPK